MDSQDGLLGREFGNWTKTIKAPASPEANSFPPLTAFSGSRSELGLDAGDQGGLILGRAFAFVPRDARLTFEFRSGGDRASRKAGAIRRVSLTAAL